MDRKLHLPERLKTSEKMGTLEPHRLTVRTQESALAKGETVVTVGGPQGDCSVVDLADVRASGFKPRCTGCDDYYVSGAMHSGAAW